jgi:hypothetical protein
MVTKLSAARAAAVTVAAAVRVSSNESTEELHILLANATCGIPIQTLSLK